MTRRVAIWLVGPALVLSACSPWTIRPIESEGSAAVSSTAATPARYVDSIWGSKLLPAILSASVEARTLVDALRNSPQDAISRYAHREADGAAYFRVKGNGVVTSIDTRSRVGLALVDIAPFDHRPDVSIQIGPVLRGTALRDATGLVRFTDFVNQLQFADVGNELNNRVLKTVLGPLDRAALEGNTVSFVGVAGADPTAAPPLRELMPIRLKVEKAP